MLRLFVRSFSLLFAWALPFTVLADTYARQAAVLRASAAATAKAVDGVDANQSLTVLESKGDWARVRLGAEIEGWLAKDVLSDTWIRVWKRERKLFLMSGDKVARELRMALGSQNPTGQKVKRGDGATPEGRYFIAELDEKPETGRYGARSMRLSYPSVEDARRGLRAKLIDRASYIAIVRAVRAGEVPPQHTALGGSIRIHGGGSQHDWTLGCIALEDEDAIAVFAEVGKGTRVDIYASADDDRASNRPEALPAKILTATKAQTVTPATYTTAAMKVMAIDFPAGDIAPSQAVCTDIVVRALRGAGLDLQALIFEDRTLHPDRYPRKQEAPRTSIDHRRVANLVAFLRRFAVSGTTTRPGSLAPGDVVVFDTGIRNGTPFDHIGIVDDKKDSDGNLQAINAWTVGYRTSSMPLIGKSYPTVVAHFRLGHPLAGW